MQRDVHFTQEVLFVKSGKIRVDFYNDDQKYLESRVLFPGDIVLLAFGGHGFEMPEESEIMKSNRDLMLVSRTKFASTLFLTIW